jgi:hypothetical protein
MTLPSTILNDPESANAWVNSLDRTARHTAGPLLLDFLLSTSPEVQRISAAYALNRLAALGARSSLIVAAFDRLPELLDVRDRDVRRAGLVATSSLVHGAKPATAAKLRSRLLERSYALARPRDAWDAELLISIVTEITRRAAPGPTAPSQAPLKATAQASAFRLLKRYKRSLFGLARDRYVARLRAELEKRATLTSRTRAKAVTR